MSDKKCGATCSDGSECEAWAMANGRCRHHGGKSTGPKTEAGKQESRTNAQTHGLHTSAEVFLEEAEQQHKDTYYAAHESLCDRYERAHGEEPLFYAKKQLAEVALDMAKLQMAAEYEAENAVDSGKPLTERQVQDVGGNPVEVERVSKVENLKTDIRRENRLLLKDMGIYESPESQQASATATIADVMQDELSE